MKTCTKCGQRYTDETLNFCLDDGARLLSERSDGPPTAILGNGGPGSEDETMRFAGFASQSMPQAGEEFWIAVLPFRSRGTADGIESLAEDLAEDIVLGLSLFSYLKVVSRLGSADPSMGAGNKKIDPKFLLDGTIRQSEGELRIAVKLTAFQMN